MVSWGYEKIKKNLSGTELKNFNYVSNWRSTYALVLKTIANSVNMKKSIKN